METQAVHHGGRWMWAGAAALAVAILGAPLEAVLATGDHRAVIQPLLAPLSAALVLVASALTAFQWYVARSVTAPWVSVAFALLSVRIVLRFVFPLAGGAGEVEQAIGCACMLLAVALLSCALARRHGFPLARVVAVAALATAVLGGIEFGAHRSVPELERVETAVPLFAWGAVALVSARCVRRDRAAYTFGALALGGIAVPLHVVATMVHDSVGLETLDRSVGLLFVGSLIVVAAAVGDVHVALDSQRAELDLHRTQSMLADEQARRERETAQERAHEASSALVAIEGAVRTLERHYELLPATARRDLSSGVYAEVRRLQLLVDADAPHEPAAVIDLEELISSAAALARARGQEVVVDVEPGLEASGEPTGVAAALKNLLVNVSRHAEGSSVDVWARHDAGRVIVDVADRGPGVPVADVERIFARGARGSMSRHVPGQGLGLYVARRTARRHGGELRYLDRPGGGAVFRLELEPAPAVGEPGWYAALEREHVSL